MIPDRSHIDTERVNPRSTQLHTLDAAGLVALFNSENRAVLVALAMAEGDLARLITAATPGFLRGGRVVYLGAGTSGRLGVLDASEIPPTFCEPPGRFIGIIAGGDRSLRIPSEGAEDDARGAIPELEQLALTADDTVIGIAAGGTTPYVQGALQWASGQRPAASGQRPATSSQQPAASSQQPAASGQQPATSDQRPAASGQQPAPSSQHPAASGQQPAASPLCCLLTCADVPAPPGCRRILLATGPEVLTGSTRLKAGTATKLALNTISTALMVLAGKVQGNLMVDVKASNVKLRDRAARIVVALTNLDRDAAFALLGRAGWSAKTAVAMHRLDCDQRAAETSLAAAGGRLDRLVR